MENTISGIVTGGNKIGRTLGFPTANIEIDDSTDIPNGVYLAKVNFEGQSFDGVANIGTKPSVSDGLKRFLEVHIFDFQADLYGKYLKVEIKDFIRDEKKFESMRQLKEQIAQDKTTALNILKSE